MRTSLRFAGLVLVAGFLGVAPASAQDKEQPKSAEAELQRAREQLDEKLSELRDEDAKQAELKKELERLLKDVQDKKPKPDAPKAGAQPRPMAWMAAPGGDPAMALKGLLISKDPKVAALAKELLERLSRTAPGAIPPRSGTFEIELVPNKPGTGGIEFTVPSPAAKSGGIELRLEGAKPGTPVPPTKLIPAETKTTERRIVLVEKAEGAGGASSLKLSADGKTAAVVSADGTVTVYDVASGKELMKFPGKK